MLWFCRNNLAHSRAVQLDKSIFEHLNVMGQADNKFIVATASIGLDSLGNSKAGDQTLLVFDQHAVHERVRLEKLVEGQ